MEKPTILALTGIMPAEMQRLESRYNVIKLYKSSQPEADLQAVKDQVQGIISTMNTPVRQHLIENLPNLKIITNYAVGYDNIDVDAAKANKVIVTNTPDVVTDDTADIALGLVLAVSRRLVEGDMYVRVGKWLERPMPLGTSPKGKTAGIVGFGRIGRAIAKRLTAIDMQVVYHGRTPKADAKYPYFNNLIEMAKVCDYLILSCSGGAATKHLVSEKVLQALGEKGFLINVARGSVVDEAALVTALQNKWIAGAGLDVFADEPRVPQALLALDNVVLLPHIGAATVETRSIMSEIILANLDAFFAGKPVLTPVTK